MNSDYFTITVHLVVALIAGGIIGGERSYNGHPAGFRTHMLVCMASSLLMLVTIYQGQWFSGAMIETVRVDPTRMAQGIMTGIGFLGAGVIMREGFSVRGLTTAASIWITAAIGILAGIGFYSAVITVTILTIGTLSAVRWIESIIPALIYVRLTLSFHRDKTMPENEVRNLIEAHGVEIVNLSYALLEDGKFFQYFMLIRTRKASSISQLSQTLCSDGSVVEYRTSMSVD